MSWSICHGLLAGEGTSALFHITVPAVFEGVGVPAHFLQKLVPQNRPTMQTALKPIILHPQASQRLFLLIPYLGTL